MLSAIFAALFAYSLLPGRTPACMVFARRISGGIVPEGADEYCRKLTWVWLGVLAALAAASVIDWRLGFISPIVIALVFFLEGRIRRRRFSVEFRTSGSTGNAKRIVKTFESLAREVAMHRDYYKEKIPSGSITFLATIDSPHMYGTLWRKMLPKALGCECIDDTILTPEALLAHMAAAKKVFLVTTPTFLKRFCAYSSQYEVPQNCIEIVTSGSLLAADAAARAKEVFGVTPREIFGSTETGGVAWRRQEHGDEAWMAFEPVKLAATSQGTLIVRSPFCLKHTWRMSDKVHLAKDARSFKLGPRADRIVKINENMVDLAAVEDAVRSLGWRECAATTLELPHGKAVAAVVAGCAGDSAPAVSILDIRRRLAKVLAPCAVPRRIRIVREIPRNAQGKVVNGEIRAILESALVEPEILEDIREATMSKARVRFSPDAPYFRGHFPGLPILPGVVQLALATRWAGAIMTGDAAMRPKEVKKMKFSAVIRPGEIVDVTLRQKDAASVEYRFTKGTAVCSSGLLVY